MEDFNALDFIEDANTSYGLLVGQYFDGDYCPTLLQIENMYSMTNLSAIEVPLSVKEMFEAEV